MSKVPSQDSPAPPTLPAAPLLPPNPSCLILAPRRTFTFAFHYSLFNSHYWLVVDTLLPVTLEACRAIEGLLCIFLPISPRPPPLPSPPSPWPSYPCRLWLPHLVTTNLYTIITARCVHLSLHLACRRLVEWLRDSRA